MLFPVRSGQITSDDAAFPSDGDERQLHPHRPSPNPHVALILSDGGERQTPTSPIPADRGVKVLGPRSRWRVRDMRMWQDRHPDSGKAVVEWIVSRFI
jgi:hypothetical protein